MKEQLAKLKTTQPNSTHQERFKQAAKDWAKSPRYVSRVSGASVRRDFLEETMAIRRHSARVDMVSHRHVSPLAFAWPLVATSTAS